MLWSRTANLSPDCIMCRTAISRRRCSSSSRSRLPNFTSQTTGAALTTFLAEPVSRGLYPAHHCHPSRATVDAIKRRVVPSLRPRCASSQPSLLGQEEFSSLLSDQGSSLPLLSPCGARTGRFLVVWRLWKLWCLTRCAKKGLARLLLSSPPRLRPA